MLDPAMGTLTTVEGRSVLLTGKGRSGYAVYGPYDPLSPGHYAVEFRVALDAAAPDKTDFCCAVLDVATDVGSTIVASRKVMLSQLRDGRNSFVLRFSLAEPHRVEYRIKTTGKIALAIDEHRLVVRLPDDADDNSEEQLRSLRFPEEEGASNAFFQEHKAELRRLHEHDNAVVRVRDDDVVLTVGGVSLLARRYDDIRFVGEVLLENVYNFHAHGDVCAIDIGMNVGLSSLQFARKPEVQEVHSFEPFTNTFDRAVDNLALNPALSRKITPYNVGLSDEDKDGVVFVEQTADSGAMSTVGAAGTLAVSVSLRDAATMLRPIIEQARAQNRQVIVKMDCEGSEFAIVRSLAAGGLLPLIAAFMVEWHDMFGGKSLEDLIGPMKREGFLIFDRSPARGNGFFYAARVGTAEVRTPSDDELVG
jgi:FkbM family methyltransferase